MGRDVRTGRTPAARYAAPRPSFTMTTPRNNHPYLPPPQPSVSIDFPATLTIVSALFAVVSWIYTVAMSFGANALLSAGAFSCFLLSTLLGLGSSARLAADFSREHWGYNVPLARRVFIWHRSLLGGVVAFYSGALLQVGTSAWALIESRRTAAGVTLLLLGGAAVLLGAALHWHMVTHPLGVATDTIYTGPGYEIVAPQEGEAAPVPHHSSPRQEGGVQPPCDVLQPSVLVLWRPPGTAGEGQGVEGGAFTRKVALPGGVGTPGGSPPGQEEEEGGSQPPVLPTHGTRGVSFHLPPTSTHAAHTSPEGALAPPVDGVSVRVGVVVQPRPLLPPLPPLLGRDERGGTDEGADADAPAGGPRSGPAARVPPAPLHIRQATYRSEPLP